MFIHAQRRGAWALGAVVALALVLVPSATSAAGDPDTGFAGTGLAKIDFASASDYGREVVIQADKKIVVGGTSGGDFALIRLTSKGVLDPTFGGDGRVTVDFASGADTGADVVIQPDGRIVIAGAATTGGQLRIALARVLPNGSLDTSFGSGGRVVAPIPNSSAQAVNLRSDGRIVVAGTIVTTAGGSDFGIAQFSSSGSLDLGFGGGDGWVVTDLAEPPYVNTSEEGLDAALQPDGKLVLVGWTYRPPGWRDFAVARYDQQGNLDSTFGAGKGWVSTDFVYGDSADAVALQADGKIVVAGPVADPAIANYGFGLARYNTDGSLDPTFGSGGKVATAVGTIGEDLPHDVAITASGRIVVGGRARGWSGGTDFNFALVQYLSNGTVDRAFGSDGRVVIPSPGYFDEGYSVAIQADDRIVLAGHLGDNASGWDFGIARVKPVVKKK